MKLDVKEQLLFKLVRACLNEENASSTRPGADRRGKFQPLFMSDFTSPVSPLAEGRDAINFPFRKIRKN